jgi:hypothetical protein
MNAVDRVLAVTLATSQTNRLLGLIRDGDLDEAQSLAVRRDQDLRTALAEPLTAEDHSMFMRLLHVITIVDAEMQSLLLNRQSDCRHKLKQLRCSRNAEQAYGEYFR